MHILELLVGPIVIKSIFFDNQFHVGIRVKDLADDWLWEEVA